MGIKAEKELVVIAKQSIGSVWLCIDADLDENEALGLIVAALNGRDCIVSPPISDPALVRDRLYGGWRCSEDPNRRHVYFCGLCYRWGVPEENRPATAEDRRRVWRRLFEANSGDDWIGGVFTSGAEEFVESQTEARG